MPKMLSVYLTKKWLYLLHATVAAYLYPVAFSGFTLWNAKVRQLIHLRSVLVVQCLKLHYHTQVAYIIAFSVELWWTLEATVSLPIPAYLLCVGYFTLFLFSSLLLRGLSSRKNTFLLVWMFIMGILLGPEAGLVLYMSIHHWRITTLNGLIEVTCWACRLLVNVTAMICVQSLYSTWREEKALLLRLHALKMSPVPPYHRDRLSELKIPPRHDYMNHGYQPEETKSETIIPMHPQDDNIFLDPFFASPLGNFSEFNASTFSANVVDNRNKYMPSLPQLIEESEKSEESIIPKTQSLLDFRESDEFNNIEVSKRTIKNKSISLNYINYLGNKGDKLDKKDNDTQSLDRKIIKSNKDFKIFKKFSPFLPRKNNDEINVYQIHPPKVFEGALVNHVGENCKTTLDNQLNKIYSTRGMYAFDEKSKKVVFYPPEFFNVDEIKKFRNRVHSNASSRSRSSLTDDSEEIRRISDVAL